MIVGQIGVAEHRVISEKGSMLVLLELVVYPDVYLVRCGDEMQPAPEY
jgi:hypothetical protein